jgi:hypothetical protein
VLSSKTQLLRKSVEKKAFNVLLPAALPPETKVVFQTVGASSSAKTELNTQLTAAMTNTTFAIAFDATGSMEKFAAQVALDLRTAFESLPQDVAKGTRIGFVFFSDETDVEKRVISGPKPVADAVNMLKDVATPDYMKGGGDPAEPVWMPSTSPIISFHGLTAGSREEAAAGSSSRS